MVLKNVQAQSAQWMGDSRMLIWAQLGKRFNTFVTSSIAWYAGSLSHHFFCMEGMMADDNVVTDSSVLCSLILVYVEPHFRGIDDVET